MLAAASTPVIAVCLLLYSVPYLVMFRPFAVALGRDVRKRGILSCEDPKRDYFVSVLLEVLSTPSM